MCGLLTSLLLADYLTILTELTVSHGPGCSVAAPSIWDRNEMPLSSRNDAGSGSKGGTNSRHRLTCRLPLLEMLKESWEYAPTNGGYFMESK